MSNVKDWKDIQQKMQTEVIEYGTVPPTATTIELISTDFNVALSSKNRYWIIDAMCALDPELDSDIDTIGSMCSRYYNGVVYNNKTGLERDPTKLSEQKDLLIEAQRFASADQGIDYRALFRSFGRMLMKHGDAVCVKIKTSTEITGLQPLPMRYVTAVENVDQIGKGVNVLDLMQDANIYLYCENDTSKMKQWTKEKIFHISIDNFAEYIIDNVGRATFGIWSSPPINSLQTDMRWKLNSIMNDILWRHRSVPREWHKLNLSQFTPDRYPEKKTYSDRVAAAQADAQTAADTYKDGLGTEALDSDQIYITDMQTEITYVEPKTTNYTDPNQIITQINTSISRRTQVPTVGEKSYASAYWSVSIGLMVAESFAEKIKEALERLLREHLHLKFPTKQDDEIQKIEIQTRLILDRDRSELAKTIAILSGTKAFTKNELREFAGMPKLPDEEGEQLSGEEANVGRQPATKTVADVSRDEERSGDLPGYPRSPK